MSYGVMDATVKLPYNWALGNTWTRFFDCLKNEKIYGTKCKQCDRTFVPARSFCPDCYSDAMEWVEVGQEGTLQSWAIQNKLLLDQEKAIPYIVALIKLDGADNNFCHFIGGNFKDLSDIKNTLKVGMRVKPVWKKEKNADILDIAHFEPVK